MSRYFKNNSGFTLTELVTTITIVTIILSVILSGQSTYSDRLSLVNVTDEISSRISQAQAYAVGVREVSPGSSEFTAPYGLAFNLSGSGSNASYIYFADKNSNTIYDGDWSCATGGANECLEKVLLSRSNTITSLCMIVSGGSDSCAVDRINITFARPKTEAKLVFFNAGSQVINGNMIGAKINLMSPKGATTTLVVYQSGQISSQ